MKKYLFLIIMIIGINKVYATSGALVSSSIKTCPDGKIYGYHSSPRHWHEAEYTPREKGSNYSAIGNAIYEDPCLVNEEPVTSNNEANNNVSDDNNYSNTEVNNYTSDNNNQIDINNNIDNNSTDNFDLPLNNDDTANEIQNDDEIIPAETNSNDIKDNTNKKDNNNVISKNNTINDNKDNDSSIFDSILGIGVIGGSIALVSKIKKKN